jgi:hypothetical protein
MASTPTGRMITGLTRFKSLLAASPTWIAWCGVGVTPADRIYLRSAATAKAPLPMALLAWSDDLVGRRDGVAIDGFIRAGSIVCGIDALATVGATNEDAEIDFWNKLEGVLTDLENAGTRAGGTIAVLGWAITAGPDRIAEEQRAKWGDRFQVDIAFAVEDFN